MVIRAWVFIRFLGPLLASVSGSYVGVVVQSVDQVCDHRSLKPPAEELILKPSSLESVQGSLLVGQATHQLDDQAWILVVTKVSFHIELVDRPEVTLQLRVRLDQFPEFLPSPTS